MGMGGAPQTGEGGGGPLGGFMSFLPFIAIIAIFYFLIIRPQNKKRKETENMIKALKRGDKVVTIGGVHGIITSVRENTVVVKVDDDTKIEFSRSAVSSIESASRDKEEDKDDEEDEASSGKK